MHSAFFLPDYQEPRFPVRRFFWRALRKLVSTAQFIVSCRKFSAGEKIFCSKTLADFAAYPLCRICTSTKFLSLFVYRFSRIYIFLSEKFFKSPPLRRYGRPEAWMSQAQSQVFCHTFLLRYLDNDGTGVIKQLVFLTTFNQYVDMCWSLVKFPNQNLQLKFIFHLRKRRLQW